MDHDSRTDNSTRDTVQKLAIDMARLTVMAEEASKARADEVTERRIMKHDLGTVLAALQGLPQLNDKISAMAADLKREMADGNATNAKAISDLAANLTEKITTNSTQIATLRTDVDTIKSWKDKLDGASGAYSKVAGWVWALVGSMGASIIGLVVWYFQSHHGGGIGGE